MFLLMRSLISYFKNFPHYFFFVNARKLGCSPKPHYISKITNASLGMLLSLPVKVMFLSLSISVSVCELDNSKVYK